ncbi:MAG TPA: glycosyltransferase [Candidatus Omnitrophota bacterium]|nr:glycosyltransferase [Candidatus Omnitrophota bacterium]
MKISIVIPTYKRDDLLRRCLESLVNQRLPSSEYEIIVVDDAYNRPTHDVVMEFSQRYREHNFRYIPVSGTHGPAAARNIGWKNADGEIIAFIDDDCIANPDWLVEGAYAFSRDTAAVSGRIIVPIPKIPSDQELCVSWMEECNFLTANSFYSKKVLEETGGFDERFRMAWREDTDLYFNVLSRNYPVKFSLKAIVTHPVKKRRWGTGFKEEKKNQYNALLYKKYKTLFKKTIEEKPPLHYYAAVICFLIAVFGGIFLPELKLFFIPWLAISLSFAERRLRSTSKHPLDVLEILYTSFILPFFSIFWRLTGAIRFKTFYF